MKLKIASFLLAVGVAVCAMKVSRADNLLGDIVRDAADKVDGHVDGKMLESKNKLKGKAACGVLAKKHKNPVEWRKCCEQNGGSGDGCDEQVQAEAEAKAQEENDRKEQEKADADAKKAE